MTGKSSILGNDPADWVILQTAGKPQVVQLTADRTVLTADGQDLSYVDVAVVDSRGIPDLNADNRLVIKVSGPAMLAGMGNADLKDTDSYAGPSHKAWHGRALVVIRSTQQAGKITVTVNAGGLKSGELVLQAARVPGAR